jgi:hypothetical protein
LERAYSIPIGSTIRPKLLALACTILVRLIQGALARHHSPTITEKLRSSFRVRREIACVYEKAKKDNLQIPTMSIKATPSIFPIPSQAQTQLSLHGRIKSPVTLHD